MTDSSKISRQKWKRPLAISLGICSVLAATLSYYLYGLSGLPYTLVSLAMMFLGLKISEVLIALLTGIAKTNMLGGILVFALKLVWWATLFYLTRLVDARFAIAIAIGIGAFLLAILAAALQLGGMPKISYVDKRDS